ncbi:MAG: AI-2E family transporter [Armatimonadota bacterium]
MGLRLDAGRVKFAAFIIVLAVLIVVLVLFLRAIWSVLQIFIIAGLVVLTLDWLVEWLVLHRVPRWAASLVILLIFFTVVGLFVFFLIPPMVTQFQGLIAELPGAWARTVDRWGTLLERSPTFRQAFDPGTFLANLLRGAGTWAQAARTVFTTAVGAFTAAILIFVVTFYTLLNPWPLVYGLRGLFPEAWWSTIDCLAHEIAVRIRGWAVGTFVLSLVIGVLDYVALLLINAFSPEDIPFILFFAIFGGLMEVVPIIGPIAAAILPALVAFSISPLLGVFVLLAFFVIQQLENHILAPMIMHRAVHLHPVSLIFALVVMSTLFGIFGAVIAVPVASIVKVLYDEWYYPLMHEGKKPGMPPKEGPPEEPEEVTAM